MRFILLDKVTELVVAQRITTVKALSLAEEYLADHFATFPVLPGVLMIEALVQSAGILVHVTNDFRQSIIVLQEARNVKYKSFVKPGNILRMELTARSIDEQSSSFLAAGFVDDRPVVEGRFQLRHFNLADENEKWAQTDEKIRQEMRYRARLLGA